MLNWFVIISGTVWTAHRIKETWIHLFWNMILCFFKRGQWLEKLVSNLILQCFHFQIDNKEQRKKEKKKIVEQNEIWHSFILSLCQGQLPHLLQVSPGEGGQLKLQRRRGPIWVVQTGALVSEVLEQSERCELSNQFFVDIFDVLARLRSHSLNNDTIVTFQIQSN